MLCREGWKKQTRVCLPDGITFCPVVIVETEVVVRLIFQSMPEFEEKEWCESVRLFLLGIKEHMFDASIVQWSDLRLFPTRRPSTKESGRVVFEHLVHGIPIDLSYVDFTADPGRDAYVIIGRPNQDKAIEAISPYADLVDSEERKEAVKNQACAALHKALQDRTLKDSDEYIRRNGSCTVDEIVFFPVDGKLVLAVVIDARGSCFNRRYVVSARDPSLILHDRNNMFM